MVGAGPGDPELITLKGRRLLQRADLIAYDDLIHPQILAFAPTHCRLLPVGYRGKVHDEHRDDQNKSSESPVSPQTSVHGPLVHPEILKALAQGQCVVRLKCGDPMIFGRSGEEAAILRQHGFSCVYIPGITAAFGAAASAGIPLTDRRLASSVTLMTGHRGASHLPDDKPKVAGNPDGTLAIYMPRKHLKGLCQDLIEKGWDPETPLAFVAAATTPSQRIHRSTIKCLDGLQDTLGSHLPGLALIGSTVGLGREGEGLQDPGATLPLRGMRVVILRSHGGPSRLAPRLRRLGADVIGFPLMTPVPVPVQDVDPAFLVDESSPWDQILLRRVLDAKMFLQSISHFGIDLRQMPLKKKWVTTNQNVKSYLFNMGIQTELLPKSVPLDPLRTLVSCSSEEKTLKGIPWPCYSFQKRAVRIKAPEPDLWIVPHHKALDIFLSFDPKSYFSQESWADKPWIALGPSLAQRLLGLGVKEVHQADSLAGVVERVRVLRENVPKNESVVLRGSPNRTEATRTHNNKGQIIVYTGQGKGKTTAALGLVFRAMGYGRKVGVVQFIKGKWPTGERRFAASLPTLDFYVMGKGFTWDSDDLAQDRALARKAWDKSKDLIQSGLYDVVILDEITYVINYGFVEIAEVVATLAAKPPGVSVILTGRKAHPTLLEIADVVTEMQEVKHPFKSGQRAQQGLDY